MRTTFSLSLQCRNVPIDSIYSVWQSIHDSIDDFLAGSARIDLNLCLLVETISLRQERPQSLDLGLPIETRQERTTRRIADSLDQLQAS